eukprot:gene12079-biopygen7910
MAATGVRAPMLYRGDKLMKIRRRRRRLRKNANLTAMSQHCVRTPPQAWPGGSPLQIQEADKLGFWPTDLNKKSWSKESRIFTRLENCGAKQQTSFFGRLDLPTLKQLWSELVTAHRCPADGPVRPVRQGVCILPRQPTPRGGHAAAAAPGPLQNQQPWLRYTFWEARTKNGDHTTDPA